MDYVYLASPYSHEDDAVMQCRHDFVAHVTVKQMYIQSYYENRAVFSPLVRTHALEKDFNAPSSWTFWKEQDLPMLYNADELLVLMLPGWTESEGVTAEIEFAQENDIPVTYLEPFDYVYFVGISGRKRSGKDTLADLLLGETDEPFVKMAFADSLKETVQAAFGFTDEQLWGDEKEQPDDYWNVTPREVLRDFGMDLREAYGARFWIDRLKKRVLDEGPYTHVFVPDVRFPNEATFIQDEGGLLIRVDASERLDHNDNHESEVAMDRWDGRYDVVVDNNGPLADLKAKAKSIAQEI